MDIRSPPAPCGSVDRTSEVVRFSAPSLIGAEDACYIQILFPTKVVLLVEIAGRVYRGCEQQDRLNRRPLGTKPNPAAHVPLQVSPKTRPVRRHLPPCNASCVWRNERLPPAFAHP